MQLPSFLCNGFMYAGIIEGFSFDSEDEADKMPKFSTRQTDQNEGDEKQTNGKTKGNAEKASVCSRNSFSNMVLFIKLIIIRVLWNHALDHQLAFVFNAT